MFFGRTFLMTVLLGFSGMQAAQNDVSTVPASVTLNFSNGFTTTACANVVRKYAELEKFVQSRNSEIQVETNLEINESVFKMLTQLVISRQEFFRQAPYDENDLKTVIAFVKKFKVDSHDFGGNSINLKRLGKLVTK